MSPEQVRFTAELIFACLEIIAYVGGIALLYCFAKALIEWRKDLRAKRRREEMRARAIASRAGLRIRSI